MSGQAAVAPVVQGEDGVGLAAVGNEGGSLVEGFVQVKLEPFRFVLFDLQLLELAPHQIGQDLGQHHQDVLVPDLHKSQTQGTIITHLRSF